MLRVWLLAAGTALIALAFVACGGSSSHSDSQPVTPSAGAGQGGTALGGGGAGSANAGSGGQAAAGSPAAGGQAAAGSPAGGQPAAGSAAMGGSSNVAGMSGSAGAQTNGGSGWIVPATPGAGWTGPQDPACPAAAVVPDAACTSPPGTRCSYPEPGGTYTLRCQCYKSSTGDARWWCEDHAGIGFDLCPVAFPGDGSCPNFGDETCYYVDNQDKLRACDCAAGTTKCFPWGL